MTTQLAESTPYTKAASLLKTEAILAIVFGSIGIIVSFALVALYILVTESGISLTQEESIEMFFYGIITPIFLFVSHIYLIISGTVLLQNPTPKLAKVLSIINIVIGALWNLVLLIFAILYIAQSAEYEKGYKPKK
ncbi:MAG: hypothetical protein V4611_04655 [Patescibacteria group bacterium]